MCLMHHKQRRALVLVTQDFRLDIEWLHDFTRLEERTCEYLKATKGFYS